MKQFALNLRADVLGSNVRVTNIEPGLTDTDFMLVRFGGDAEKKEGFNQGLTPITAEDIAEAIFWSCTLPRNVNINRIQMMPITQAFPRSPEAAGLPPSINRCRRCPWVRRWTKLRERLAANDRRHVTKADDGRVFYNRLWVKCC